MGKLLFTLGTRIAVIVGIFLASQASANQAQGLPDSPIDSRDLVQYASGAIQFRPPLGWQVAEVAKGQEVRLLILPPQTLPTSKMPRANFWLSYHVRPLDDRHNAGELQEMMIPRLKMATENLAIVKKLSKLRIGPWQALKQEFFIPSSKKGHPSKSLRRSGFHLLVRTTWGILEIHAEANDDIYPERKMDYERILESLVLQAPKNILQPLPIEKVLAAKTILGKWKTIKGRFILQPNGRILIQFDREGIYPIDSQGSSKLQSRLTYLSGHYTAQEDLLLVVWDDGSRMNFRWRENRGQLFLTDHTGRVSQLRRLLE